VRELCQGPQDAGSIAVDNLIATLCAEAPVSRESARAVESWQEGAKPDPERELAERWEQERSTREVESRTARRRELEARKAKHDEDRAVASMHPVVAVEGEVETREAPKQSGEYISSAATQALSHVTEAVRRAWGWLASQEQRLTQQLDKGSSFAECCQSASAEQQRCEEMLEVTTPQDQRWSVPWPLQLTNSASAASPSTFQYTVRPQITQEDVVAVNLCGKAFESTTQATWSWAPWAEPLATTSTAEALAPLPSLLGSARRHTAGAGQLDDKRTDGRPDATNNVFSFNVLGQHPGVC